MPARIANSVGEASRSDATKKKAASVDNRASGPSLNPPNTHPGGEDVQEGVQIQVSDFTGPKVS